MFHNVWTSSSSTSSTSKTSVQNIIITSRASWNCPFRGHSIITPSLGVHEIFQFQVILWAVSAGPLCPTRSADAPPSTSSPWEPYLSLPHCHILLTRWIFIGIQMPNPKTWIQLNIIKKWLLGIQMVWHFKIQTLCSFLGVIWMAKCKNPLNNQHNCSVFRWH